MGKVFTNKRRPTREGRMVTVGQVEQVPPGRGATVKLTGGKEVALFNVGGTFYAVENHCPHKGYPLADSRIYGNIVECDLHGWRFDVRDGTCFTKPGCRIESYEVVIEDGWIKIVV